MSSLLFEAVEPGGLVAALVGYPGPIQICIARAADNCRVAHRSRREVLAVEVPLRIDARPVDSGVCPDANVSWHDGAVRLDVDPMVQCAIDDIGPIISDDRTIDEDVGAEVMGQAIPGIMPTRREPGSP